MEQNNKLRFKIMVTFPHLLENEITRYNKVQGTDFKIVETIQDEVPFCVIEATQYQQGDVFNLGYSLAATQYLLKAKGELDW